LSDLDELGDLQSLEADLAETLVEEDVEKLAGDGSRQHCTSCRRSADRQRADEALETAGG
jgi:hypothetical protein